MMRVGIKREHLRQKAPAVTSSALLFALVWLIVFSRVVICQDMSNQSKMEDKSMSGHSSHDKSMSDSENALPDAKSASISVFMAT